MVNMNDLEHVSELLNTKLDSIDAIYHSEKKITGLYSDFTVFDQYTLGLHQGDLIVIAARPSMGRSFFIYCLAANVAIKNDVPVAIFSMGMSSSDVTSRLLMSFGQLNQYRLETGSLQPEEWSKLSIATSLLSSSRLFIDDTSAMTVKDIREKMTRFNECDNEKIGMVVIDSLSMLVSGNELTSADDLAPDLKALAKEFNVPVVVSSQVSRDPDYRHDKRPILADLQADVTIEEYADVIACIYRDEVHNKKCADKDIAEVILMKNHHGATGVFKLDFINEYLSFKNSLA